MQIHVTNNYSFKLLLSLFSGLWQIDKRKPTQDDPEPDWGKLHGYGTGLGVKYARHEQKADAKWARDRLRRLAYAEKNKVRQPRSTVAQMRLGYDTALNTAGGNDATSTEQSIKKTTPTIKP